MLSIFSKKTFLITIVNEDGTQEVIAACKSRNRAEEVIDRLLLFVDEVNLIIEDEPDWRHTGEWQEWNDHKWATIFRLEYPFDLPINGDPTNLAERLHVKEVKLV